MLSPSASCCTNLRAVCAGAVMKPSCGRFGKRMGVFNAPARGCQVGGGRVQFSSWGTLPACLSSHRGPAMPSHRKFLAFDLGAESGRGVLGLLDGQKVELQVVHRFPNGPVRVLDRLYWDVLRLHAEILQGLRVAAAHTGGIDSVGIDTWGVDFGLLGRDGSLLGNPRHYRDPHTETVMQEALNRVPRAEVFRQTGIQFMRFNTLYQLLALQRDGSPLLEAARHLLF